MNKFLAAALQIDSQDNVDINLENVSELVKEAAGRGAKLIAMPENMHYVGSDSFGHAEVVPGGKTFKVMSGLAKKYNVRITTISNIINGKSWK